MPIYRKQSGFTIVELLIVIVVIAVLASISVVAYNGIQTRAKNASRFAEANHVMKLLELYKTYNGDYPKGTASTGYCIGTGFPSGKCKHYEASGLPNAYNETDATMTNALRTVGSVPDKHTPSGTSVGPYIITSASNTSFDLNVFVQGSDTLADCPTNFTWRYKYPDSPDKLLCVKTYQYTQ